MIRTTCILLALSSALAIAQSPASSPLTADQLVDRLVANNAQYHAKLPSLEAHESIVSRFNEVIVFDKRTHTAEATVRMQPQPGNSHLQESRQFTSYEGKPYKPGQKLLLAILGDDFTDIPGVFFSPHLRNCYIFNLAPDSDQHTPFELQVHPRPDAATLSGCSLAQGRAATVRVTPDIFQIIHLEYTIPMAVAFPNHHPSSFSVDYAPVALGNQTFWLPTVVTAELPLDKSHTATWISRYSNYHQFAATSTVLPANPQ